MALILKKNPKVVNWIADETLQSYDRKNLLKISFMRKWGTIVWTQVTKSTIQNSILWFLCSNHIHRTKTEWNLLGLNTLKNYAIKKSIAIDILTSIWHNSNTIFLCNPQQNSCFFSLFLFSGTKIHNGNDIERLLLKLIAAQLHLFYSIKISKKRELE